MTMKQPRNDIIAYYRRHFASCRKSRYFNLLKRFIQIYMEMQRCVASHTSMIYIDTYIHHWPCGLVLTHSISQMAEWVATALTVKIYLLSFSVHSAEFRCGWCWWTKFWGETFGRFKPSSCHWYSSTTPHWWTRTGNTGYTSKTCWSDRYVHWASGGSKFGECIFYIRHRFSTKWFRWNASIA